MRTLDPSHSSILRDATDSVAHQLRRSTRENLTLIAHTRQAIALSRAAIARAESLIDPKPLITERDLVDRIALGWLYAECVPPEREGLDGRCISDAHVRWIATAK